MARYKVPVSSTEYGYVYVDADSIEEATEKIDDLEFTGEAEAQAEWYVGSFVIKYEAIEEAPANEISGARLLIGPIMEEQSK